MGKRYLALWFCRLKIDWAILRNPELADIPLVFALQEQNRLIVTALNQVAEKQGLQVGIRVADAKAILPHIKVLNDKLEQGQKLLRAIGEWCVRYTPVVAVDLPDGLMFDCSGCAHLWGGEDGYIKEIVTRFESKGYTVKAAIADTIGVAWAIVRYSSANCAIAEGQHKTAIMRLPPAALRLDNAILEKLHKLGFRRIENFASIPRTSLRRRFGEGMLLRLMQAFGEIEEYIKPITFPEPYTERLPSMEPIRTRTGIEIAVQQLLEGLCKRLLAEGKGICNAVFKTFRIDGITQKIEIGTNEATCHVSHLFKLFELHIGDIEPDLGIELFVLEATKIDDIDITQQALWVSKPSLQDNAILELLDRIVGKIGAKAIHRYLPQERYWPEHTVKSTEDHKAIPQTPWRKDMPRPIQMLTYPQLIEVSAPIPGYCFRTHDTKLACFAIITNIFSKF